MIPNYMKEPAWDTFRTLGTLLISRITAGSRGNGTCILRLRSYASYPKEARHIFCFKELHLGHLAKSFALRDPPSKITGIGKGHWVKNDERKREKSKQLQLKQVPFQIFLRVLPVVAALPPITGREGNPSSEEASQPEGLDHVRIRQRH